MNKLNSAPTSDKTKITVNTVDEVKAPTVEPLSKISHVKQSFLNRLKINILLSLLLTALVFLGGYLYVAAENSKNTSQEIKNVESLASSEDVDEFYDEEYVEEDRLELKPISYLTGAEFLDSPVKINDVSMFTDTTNFFGYSTDEAGKVTANVRPEDITYSKIGTTKEGNQIILVENTVQSVDGGQTYILIKDEVGYEVLARATYTGEAMLLYESSRVSFGEATASNFRINELEAFKELVFTEYAVVANNNFSTTIYDDSLLRGNTTSTLDRSNLVKIGKEDGKDFYMDTDTKNKDFDAVTVVATFKNLFYINYSLTDGVNSHETTSIDWASGTKNLSEYTSGAFAGCGRGGGFIVPKNIDKSQLENIGTLNGNTVYQLPISNKFIKSIYDEDYSRGEFVQDDTLKNMTLQQFKDQHGYFLLKNTFGQYVLYLRTDLIIIGGCGKPVVYLYPESLTKVSVSVGADVTKSVPHYPNGGWKDVLALPSGKLLYQSKVYESLFWEGYGHGAYPEITGGFVVKSEDAVNTIKQHLLAQGLNSKEISDFIEFWEPKLPRSNYTRLSWLTQNELDTLAPLTIYPQPKTVIRVFLDFEEVSGDTQLKPQVFRKQARNGFTAVEWGGLLTDGSER